MLKIAAPLLGPGAAVEAVHSDDSDAVEPL